VSPYTQKREDLDQASSEARGDESLPAPGNDRYYGIVKISGRRHGPAVLKTSKGVPITDLAMAKRVLRDWIGRFGGNSS